MKFKVILLYILLQTHWCFNQVNYTIDKYQLDSVQVYSPQIKKYIFNLAGPKQGLFCDSLKLDSLPMIEIELVNNTNSPLIHSYKERDCSVLWLRKAKYDTLHPGESMLLRSAWLRKIGNFNCPIRINSTYDGIQSQYIIQTWGYIKNKE